MARSSSRLPASWWCVALLLLTAATVLAVADPTPLANQPSTGQGTITPAQPSFEIQLDNTLVSPSILLWYQASMTAGFNDSSAFATHVRVLFQPTGGNQVVVLEFGAALLSNLSLPTAAGIPECNSYNGVELGNKVGTWWLQFNFTSPASLPEDAVATVNLQLVAQATDLTNQGTTYSQQNLGSGSFGTFVLPALNSSYTGYNVNVTVSDLSTDNLSWLNVVDLTSDASCLFGSKGSPLPVSINTTAASITIGFNNLASGTWQIRALNTANLQPTIGMSWTSVAVSEPDNTSWWTTAHIIYVVLGVVGIVLVVGIVAGGAAWFIIKRRRQYEQV